MPTTKRIILAFFIALISAIILTGFLLSYLEIRGNVDERYDELTKIPQPYTFELPTYFAFHGGNGTIQIGTMNDTDLAILFKFTYPNGTLVANEPLLINSTMVVDKVIETLDRVAVSFPNALLYPIRYGKNLLPFQGVLEYPNPFYSVESSNNASLHVLVQKDAQIIFPIDGDYSPHIKFYFRDGTTKDVRETNIVLRVYPKEQLTQLDTQRISLAASQASLRLSEAVLVLGLVSVIALIVQVLDHSETDCKYTQKTPETNDENTRINETENEQKQRFRKFRRFKKKHNRSRK